MSITKRSVNSLRELRLFVKELITLINPPVVIGLIGNLGSGKTTLTRILVEELGGGIVVTSPTFVLSQEYNTPNIMIEHWDLYRVSDAPQELLTSPDKKTVRIIEWIDKFDEISNLADLIVKLRYPSSDPNSEVREIELYSSP